MYSVLLKAVVHGHGRGTCLGTYLVYVACVVAFIVGVNGDLFSVMYLFLLHWLCTGMDEASALVRALSSSCMCHCYEFVAYFNV